MDEKRTGLRHVLGILAIVSAVTAAVALVFCYRREIRDFFSGLTACCCPGKNLKKREYKDFADV